MLFIPSLPLLTILYLHSARIPFPPFLGPTAFGRSVYSTSPGYPLNLPLVAGHLSRSRSTFPPAYCRLQSPLVTPFRSYVASQLNA